MEELNALTKWAAAAFFWVAGLFAALAFVMVILNILFGVSE